MLKEATYRDKFIILRKWMPIIVQMVKKDLKGEHLRADLRFFRKYFGGKSRAKLTVDDLVEGYLKEIVDEGNEELAEFVCNRWLIKYADVYDFYSRYLKKIDVDFDQIEEIDAATARQMVQGAEQEFGAVVTYLFSVFNSVVFPEEVYRELSDKADASVAQEQVTEESGPNGDGEGQRQMDRDVKRLTDKYEKKLAALEKKYHNDVAALKKQISTLQRKLDGGGQ